MATNILILLELKSSTIYFNFIGVLALSLDIMPILYFGKKSGNKDIGKVTDIQAVKRSIRNLLATQHYERPFHPEIGSAISQLLFDPYGPITANRLKRTVEETIANFEPRARVTKVDCNPLEDTNDYSVIIHFYVENVTTELQSMQTVLEQVR